MLVVDTNDSINEKLYNAMNDSLPYCKIIIAGTLNEHWADYLGDMLVIVGVEKGKIQTTTMVGRPGDLLIYIGALNALANLGLNVIAAEYRLSAANEAEKAGCAQLGCEESN